jgi:5-methylcytosine-specific restriction endonuclease McrA
MQHNTPVDRLSDGDLLQATERVAASERQLNAELLALLAELDARRLYLGQSCSSLFTYCTQVLHFSEHAAYHRIEAARAARQFPVILGMLAEGALTLTTVALLRPQLTTDNHAALLDAARHKSKREVEYQIACLAPKPDTHPIVRKLPTHEPSSLTAPLSSAPVGQSPERFDSPRATLAPLSPERFVLKVTLSAECHARLRRAQDLMRHKIPNGDPAMVIDRALTLLVDELERTKIATVLRPTRTPRSRQRRPSSSRHIPASIRRAVWARDEGRCAFVSARGRCTETGRLEFHHVIPFADGGSTTVGNLALRCQAHNAHEARLWSPM